MYREKDPFFFFSFSQLVSPRRCAAVISRTASSLFFLLIILQIPLFSVPCRSGICTSPMEVTSSQLIANEIFPTTIVKALLYPGTLFAKLHDSVAEVKAGPRTISDLQRLEVVVGSYLSVVGSVTGLMRPGRMSLFGMLVVFWGLVKEVIFTGNSGAYIYLIRMLVAVTFAFLSIRRDVRRILRSGTSAWCKRNAL